MSTRDNIKRKSEVNKENKQPPVQEQNQNSDSYKEITEEEKALYSGQDHIEESQNLENITEKVEVETPKQNIITRPRETYLQEKITKLENNTNLISNIKKELNGQVKNVMDDNVLITEIPADLNKFIKRNNVKNNLSVDFNEKLKYKQLKVLKEEKETLKKHLQKAEQNEKLLKDEGFLSLKIGGKEETMFDKGMKEHELKTVEKKIKNIKDKIQEADDKIYAIIQQIEPMTMKEKRKLQLKRILIKKMKMQIQQKKKIKILKMKINMNLIF